MVFLTITVWHNREISPGTDWAQEIESQLNTADIILLLVSPDFLSSDYCYSVEMQRALERHQVGEARVIPIILRPVYWQDTPFGNSPVLPTKAKPVTSWSDPEEALYDVAKGIREMLEFDGRPTGQQFPSALREAFYNETNARRRVTIVQALGNLGDNSVVSDLQTALYDADKRVREAAVHALGHVGETEALAALVSFLEDPDSIDV